MFWKLNFNISQQAKLQKEGGAVPALAEGQDDVLGLQEVPAVPSLPWALQ